MVELVELINERRKLNLVSGKLMSLDDLALEINATLPEESGESGQKKGKTLKAGTLWRWMNPYPDGSWRKPTIDGIRMLVHWAVANDDKELIDALASLSLGYDVNVEFS